MGIPADRKTLIAGFFLVVITFIAFFPALSNYFVNWDDYGYVVTNADVHQLSISTLPGIFTSFFNGNYHPLTMLAYGLEYKAFGLDPFFYHLTNLLIHCACAVLVMALLALLSGSLTAGALGALLFAVHPLRVESVAWISELKDVLCALFYFSALLAYTRYVKNGLKPAARTLALTFFLLALFSKVMAITLPLAFLLIDYLVRRKPSWPLLREKTPFFALSCIFGVAGVMAQKATNAMPASVTTHIHPLATCHALAFYLRKLALPVNLSVLYPYVRFPDMPWYKLYGWDILVVAALALAIAVAIRRSRRAAFGMLFFLATLSPVLVFFPFGSNFGADRYTYIPSVGIAYLAALLAARVFAGKSGIAARGSLAAAFCLVSLALCVLTWQRCSVWKNTVSIWENALSHTRFNAIAHYNLGNAYSDDTGDFEKAIRQYDLALNIRPGFMEVLNNKCYCLTRLGRNQEALEPCLKAIAINPALFPPYLNLGDAYRGLGDRQKAREAYEKALMISPDDRETRDKLDSLTRGE